MEKEIPMLAVVILTSGQKIILFALKHSYHESDT